jgi:hypothetical protein
VEPHAPLARIEAWRIASSSDSIRGDKIRRKSKRGLRAELETVRSLPNRRWGEFGPRGERQHKAMDAQVHRRLTLAQNWHHKGDTYELLRLPTVSLEAGMRHRAELLRRFRLTEANELGRAGDGN